MLPLAWCCTAGATTRLDACGTERTLKHITTMLTLQVVLFPPWCISLTSNWWDFESYSWVVSSLESVSRFQLIKSVFMTQEPHGVNYLTSQSVLQITSLKLLCHYFWIDSGSDYYMLHVLWRILISFSWLFRFNSKQLYLYGKMFMVKCCWMYCGKMSYFSAHRMLCTLRNWVDLLIHVFLTTCLTVGE